MKILSVLFFTVAISTFAQEKSAIEASTVSNLKFRLVGPALTSGRVSDLAIHPSNSDTWFVATASGGLWKTQNHGITFNPVFDSYSSYSVCCVKIAPSNKNTVWVGTVKTIINDRCPMVMEFINQWMEGSHLKIWGLKVVSTLAAL